jgi:hypothetical protein
MAEFIGETIVGIRELLTQGFRSLPVILGNAVLILGLAQGNFNLLFFFVGMFILTPVAVILANALFEFIFANALPESLQSLWLVANAGAPQCAIFTVGATEDYALNGVPSLWMTMMTFFFSYLMVNAYDLYTRAATSKAPKAAIDARKSQAVTSMILVGISALVFTILRYGTSCETAIGILVSGLLGYGLAKGWFTFMRNCGMGRLDDIFGISNRILPLQSYESGPQVTCMEVPKTTVS